MALHQSLQQKLLQKLSPQQIQLMKLLQVPTAVLDERIKEEIEENPALELGDEAYNDEFEQNDLSNDEDEEYEMDGSENDYDNIDISEYVQDGDDEVADYKLRDSNYLEQDETKVIPHKTEMSFMDLMHQQLGMLTLSEQQRKVAEQIVGSLDEDGYLRRDINAILYIFTNVNVVVIVFASVHFIFLVFII